MTCATKRDVAGLETRRFATCEPNGRDRPEAIIASVDLQVDLRSFWLVQQGETEGRV